MDDLVTARLLSYVLGAKPEWVIKCEQPGHVYKALRLKPFACFMRSISYYVKDNFCLDSCVRKRFCCGSQNAHLL